MRFFFFCRKAHSLDLIFQPKTLANLGPMAVSNSTTSFILITFINYCKVLFKKDFLISFCIEEVRFQYPTPSFSPLSPKMNNGVAEI